MGKTFLCCACLLLLSAVVQSEEWYLITETELLSIEQYKAKSVADKETWLSQVRALKTESERLNVQLRNQEEANSRLTHSFKQYEAELLTQLSLKNGKIALLETELNAQEMVNEKLKIQVTTLLRILIAFLTMAVVYFVVRIKR